MNFLLLMTGQLLISHESGHLNYCLNSAKFILDLPSSFKNLGHISVTLIQKTALIFIRLTMDLHRCKKELNEAHHFLKRRSCQALSTTVTVHNSIQHWYSSEADISQLFTSTFQLKSRLMNDVFSHIKWISISQCITKWRGAFEVIFGEFYYLDVLYGLACSVA